MCLAVPGKLIEVDGLRGVVELFGVRREARLDVLDGGEPGDFVLVHAGFAIEKVDEATAREMEESIRVAFGEEEALS